MSGGDGYLRHPALPVDHGFGTRGAREPERWLRPLQVHGNAVATVVSSEDGALGEADAVVSTALGRVVGVVTADCVPIFVAQPGAVAAIHAGWRGLANGVIASALATMDRVAGPSAHRVAVVGPHICARHYEVDAPVRDALRPHCGAALDAALLATRAGHWYLDLLALTRAALRGGGLGAHQILALNGGCTYGDPRRFASLRRDGPGGERLYHWIAA